MKAYFASPLFAEMEVRYNEYVVGLIREAFPTLDMYVPQEQTSINDKSLYADSKLIAEMDTNALVASDVLIAVLDGAIIDVGVASEIGVAYHAGIPIVGLYTDSRQKGADNQQKLDALKQIGESQFSYVNLYTVGLVKLNGTIVNSTAQLIEAIKTYITA